MIAQVIVDVAAKQTDRIFGYAIPDTISDVQVGSRVVVPFGPRKVQGFVVGISDHTDFQGKLRNLLLVVDEMPPLTEELVKLSEYLAKEIFSFRITLLKTMLPRVMRANYRKILLPTESGEKLPFFQGDVIDLNKTTDVKEVAYIQQLLKNKQAKVEYVVENKAKVKSEVQIELLATKDIYQAEYEKLRVNAVKQKALLADIIQNFDKYPKRQVQLEKELHLSTQTINFFVKKGLLTKNEVEVYRDPLEDYQQKARPKLTLNSEQEAAFSKIKQSIVDHQSQTYLLEGVTGSGKTEVYMHSIEATLQQGRNAIMLVPEISLTPQMVKQVKSRFGDKVAVLHSGLSAGERYDEWRRMRRGEAQVVVGARSAIFAPLKNVGLIIIDEEHEATYKQEDNPRYQARNVAIWRSKYNHAPLILGSATPSLYSRARAQKGVFKLLKLTQRANKQALPEVKLIDLKKAEFSGMQFDLSLDLIDAIKSRIDKKEQMILMLNRRGFANFMLCRNCGFVLKCPNCDVSLAMHKDTGEMQCHYCGYTEAIPKKCPNCQSMQIRFLGTGTQKVQQELNELIPDAKILRMDVDTTRRKGSYKRILDAFGDHQADILLGTQMIAKGLDFPNVTLVGVINADTGLWLPNYNSSEKTFDLLTQVAGRAGRAQKEGKVLIQTYNPEHYAINFAKTQDYEAFYHHEMAVRFEGNYPPFFYTVLISVASKNDQQAAAEAFHIKRQLMKELHLPTIVLGPTPGTISKIKNQYYYQILVKYKKEPKLNKLLHHIQDSAQMKKQKGLNIFIDNEPQRIY